MVDMADVDHGVEPFFTLVPPAKDGKKGKKKKPAKPENNLRNTSWRDDEYYFVKLPENLNKEE